MNKTQSHLILYLLVTLSPLGIDLHLPALVAIRESFGISSEMAQRSLLVFVFAMGVGQLLFGLACERFAKRTLGLIGLSLFILSSLAIYLISHYSLLLMLRVLQGLGAASLSVIASATVNEHFSKDRAAIIFSIQGGFLNLIPALAPLIGAIILTFAPWRAIFLFFALYGIMMWWLFYRNYHYQPLKGAQAINSYPLALAQIAKDHRFWLFAALCSLALGFIMTYLSIAPLLMNHAGKSTLEFSLYFGVNASIISVVSFAQKYLIACLGARKTLMIGLSLMLTASLILLLGAYADIIIFWIAIIIASVGFAFSFGASMSFALANHQNISGIASGILGACFMSCSPVLAGIILSVFGELNTNAFGGIFALLLSLALVLITLEFLNSP